MKILITGTKGLAHELAFIYSGHLVTAVSLTTGHDLHKINDWGVDFLGYDLVFNCAYSGIGQQLVLEYFYHHWCAIPDKSIVTIGSKVVTQPGTDYNITSNYWPYRIHKKTLQNMHNDMWLTACCDLKIINPGTFDSAMVSHLNVPKFSLNELARRIQSIVEDPTIKRVDLWL